MKRIIETSKQTEERKQSELLNGSCPECGYLHNLATSHLETRGVFRIQTRSIYKVKCSKCGCTYEYTDDWK